MPEAQLTRRLNTDLGRHGGFVPSDPNDPKLYMDRKSRALLIMLHQQLAQEKARAALMERAGRNLIEMQGHNPSCPAFNAHERYAEDDCDCGWQQAVWTFELAQRGRDVREQSTVILNPGTHQKGR